MSLSLIQDLSQGDFSFILVGLSLPPFFFLSRVFMFGTPPQYPDWLLPRFFSRPFGDPPPSKGFACKPPRSMGNLSVFPLLFFSWQTPPSTWRSDSRPNFSPAPNFLRSFPHHRIFFVLGGMSSPFPSEFKKRFPPPSGTFFFDGPLPRRGCSWKGSPLWLHSSPLSFVVFLENRSLPHSWAPPTSTPCFPLGDSFLAGLWFLFFG